MGAPSLVAKCRERTFRLRVAHPTPPFTHNWGHKTLLVLKTIFFCVLLFTSVQHENGPQARQYPAMAPLSDGSSVVMVGGGSRYLQDADAGTHHCMTAKCHRMTLSALSRSENRSRALDNSELICDVCGRTLLAIYSTRTSAGMRVRVCVSGR